MTAGVKRDTGIDLLRLCAMGMIVLHHLLLHGGLLFAFPQFSPSGMAVQMLNTLTRCAVNTYALISGYVMVRSRFRPSRLMGLWLQVVFYGLLAALFLPLMGGEWQGVQLFYAITPISHDNYWYFTCYAVVFCLSPFLNRLLNALNRKQTCLLMVALVSLFSILPVLMMTDRFQLNDGYHPVWLMVMYLLGGAMRLHGCGWFAKKKKAFAALVGCVLLSWAFRLVMLGVGLKGLEELLMSYTAPTMLACACALLALFSGMRMPGWMTRAAAALSPLTFGVYLIHDNPLVREYLIKMRLTGLADLNPVWMLGGLAACWGGVYALCLLLEWGRTKAFAALRVSEACGRLEKKLFQWADNWFCKADA